MPRTQATPAEYDVAKTLASEFLSGETRMLHRVIRYSTKPCHYQEDVAQHSWYVSFYCLMLYHAMDTFGYCTEIELGELLQRALLHDVDEMISGDIHRPFKYASPDLKKLVDKTVHELMMKWGSDTDVPEAVVVSALNAKSGPYGEIVALADIIAVAAFVYENVKMGNQYMKDVCENVQNILRDWIDKGKIQNPILIEVSYMIISQMKGLELDKK